jgi:hypothetical protein
MAGNQRTNPSGSVQNVAGWSQSGDLVAGEFLAPGQTGPNSPTGWIIQPPKHVVGMQVNFPDGEARVRTIQFGITPATTISQNQQQPQPSPTPPNPYVVDRNGNISTAAVTNGSPVVLFPPPTTNPVVPGNPQTLPVAGQLLQFSNDPTRIYTVLSSVAPSTVALTQPFKGTSQLRASVSVLGSATINPPPAPASTMPQSIDTIAIIQWTVQGNKVTRVITVGNGSSISAPAEAVNILVLDNTYNIVSAGGSPTGSGPGFQYTVNIQVTTGVRAAIFPPLLNWTYPPGAAALNAAFVPTDYQPFLILAATAGSGGEVVVPIPANAGVIGFSISAFDSTTPTTAPVLNVGQLDAGFGVLNTAYLSPTDPSEYIPLVPNAGYVVVKSPGADTIGFSIIWVIDG